MQDYSPKPEPEAQWYNGSITSVSTSGSYTINFSDGVADWDDWFRMSYVSGVSKGSDQDYFVEFSGGRLADKGAVNKTGSPELDYQGATGYERITDHYGTTIYFESGWALDPNPTPVQTDWYFNTPSGTTGRAVWISSSSSNTYSETYAGQIACIEFRQSDGRLVNIYTGRDRSGTRYEVYNSYVRIGGIGLWKNGWLSRVGAQNGY